MPFQSSIGKYYGQVVDSCAEPWYRFGRVISLLDRHAPVPIGVRWLDVGCQIGQFLKLLQARYRIVPTGIDNFDESNVVEVCRKYLRLEIKTPGDVINDSWRYLSREIDKTGFDLNEKFPFISALEVLEHMVDTDAFIRECRHHLEDNGYLIISTPNVNSLRNRVQVPLGIYPAGMEYRTLIHHVRLYNVSTLKSHLKEHGFELVAVVGVNFLPVRLLRFALVKRLDGWLADVFPSLCGNVIAIFKVQVGAFVSSARP